MDYYITVAIVITAFLAIILLSKKALTQKSTSCNCGHDCGTCKSLRHFTADSDRSEEFGQTGLRSHSNTSSPPLPGLRFPLGSSCREEYTKPTSQSEGRRAFQPHSKIGQGV